MEINSCSGGKRSLPSCDELASMFKSVSSTSPTQRAKNLSSTVPKVPSNLVGATSAGQESKLAAADFNKDQLVQFVAESEANLSQASEVYQANYDAFVDLARKFHSEKLNNLCLAFKNQILKQQIYFETELFDICKECSREYTHKFGSEQKNKSSVKANASFMRFYRAEMKSLVEYMRESLLNSSDTLIEAHETCRILRGLQNIESSVNKQFASLRASTTALLGHTTKNSSSSASQPRCGDEYKLTVLDDEDETNEEGESSDEKLDADRLEIEKYQLEIEELMHTLDDIELQHLQRKDLHQMQTKFLGKLKAKFKFVETKYEALSRRVANLKYESYLYKRLWYEKKRASNAAANNTSTTGSTKDGRAEVDSASISPSTSSRTSSTSSLSDYDEDDAAAYCEIGEGPADALSTGSESNAKNPSDQQQQTPVYLSNVTEQGTQKVI
jgi:hypothetical protein